jgi:hypothetical protein
VLLPLEAALKALETPNHALNGPRLAVAILRRPAGPERQGFAAGASNAARHAQIETHRSFPSRIKAISGKGASSTQITIP